MPFVKGGELSRRFHANVVEPIIDRTLPGLRYASALIGPGSEVLGYDTEMSTDHDWGPRVHLFLQDEQMHVADTLRQALKERSPEQFDGYAVDVHMTVITTVRRFIDHCLGLDLDAPIRLIDWLTFPSQTLLEITRGEVFRDDHGELSSLHTRFRYYPRDIWLYLMASTWQRIGQEEHVLLRAGYVGDELGSSIIAARIVRDVIHLCFFLERQYFPYSKWLGTAFGYLSSSDRTRPHLMRVQAASHWQQRQDSLNAVYEHLIAMHNALGITAKVDSHVSEFFSRPFKVMDGGTMAMRIADGITDESIRNLSSRLVGGIDQITDNVDVLEMHAWRGHATKTAREALIQLLSLKHT